MENEIKPELDEVSENIDISSSSLEQEVSSPSDKLDISKPSESSVSDGNEGSLDTTLEDNSDQTNSSKKSRELKSLLALSKEANLSTNISHKRKKEVKDSPRVYTDSDSKKSNKGTTENTSFKFPVTAESELDDLPEDEESRVQNDGYKLVKRKRDYSNDSLDRNSEDGHRRNKKTSLGAVKIFKPNKDAFCWRCHREGVNVVCETCPRSYHQKCLKQTIMDANHWPCPECVAILKAESTQSRSPAMKGMTLEHLCNLLKFALQRMIQCQGSEPFMHPVSETEFPDYRTYILQPMDLTMLEKNIKDNLYGSTQAFEADAKWLLHNSIIFNSSQSKLTSAAKTMIKICKQEMLEIENCPSCYLKANVNKTTWFVEVCPEPHILVWAKLKGFPYWPAKAMSVNGVGMVDVRFFGAHDRAWVHWRECFLYSEKDPNTFKQKRFDIERCIEELNVYIENLKRIYGEFRYAPYKTPLDPDNMSKQLLIFLPKYKSVAARRKSILDTVECKGNANAKRRSDESEKLEACSNVDQADHDTTMEGYGTDDEVQSELNMESRNAFTGGKKSTDIESIEDEEDMDDTQIPANVSADRATSPKVKVRIKGGGTDPIGKLKLLPLASNENHLAIEEVSLGRKSRKNSEQSVKSDTSRISDVSDRINILENVKVLPGNDDKGPSSNGESSGSENNVEMKKRPVQVDINNSEISISPNKPKISDQLIKRLTDIKKIKKIKKLSTQNDVSIDASTSSDVSTPPTSSKIRRTEKSNVINGNEDSLTEEKQQIFKMIQTSWLTWQAKKPESSVDDPKCKENLEVDSTEKTDRPQAEEPTPTPAEESNQQEQQAVKLIEETDKEKPVEAEKTDVSTTEDTETATTEKTAISEPLEKTLTPSDKIEAKTVEEEEESNDQRMVIDKNNSIDVTHEKKNEEITISSAKSKNPTVIISLDSDGEREVTKKRKLSNDDQPHGPAKLVKLVSIEKILNQKGEEDKLDKTEKKIAEDPVDESAGEKVTQEDIKSEPESDYDMAEDTQNLEEKRKYLSALNIHEKTDASEKTERNEIRTRSKAEEKRERFKVVDNLTRIIDDVALNYSAKHEGEKISPKNPERKKSTVSLQLAQQEGEIFVKSFAKLAAGNSNKQRARKTFPTPSYVQPASKSLSKEVQPVQKCLNPIVAKPIVTTIDKATIPGLTLINSIVRSSTNSTTSTSVSTSAMPPTSMATQALINVSAPPTSIALQPSVNLLHNQKIVDSNITISHKNMAMGHVIIMPNGAVNYCSPILNSMVTPTTQALTACPPLIQSQTVTKSVPNLKTSQNYIPHSDDGSGSPSPPVNNLNDLVNQSNQKSTTMQAPQNRAQEVLEAVATTSTVTNGEVVNMSSDNSAISIESQQQDDEFSVLNGLVPDNVSKAVSELLLMPPPRLRPRPPGITSQIFDEGIPSTAGDFTARINSMAHRMSDYFRGMLIESMDDLGKTNNPEAKIVSLQLELEALKHRHSVEMAEIRKNVCSILKDIQRSIIEEREKIVDETRAACEAETIRRVEVAKSKQWCANCPKEAQFYCCWNTSYCDYPCQQKHWPQHAGKCTQNIEKSTGTAAVAPPARTGAQPIVLRPAAPPPKSAMGRFITKPAKVYLNRTTPQKNIKGIPASGLALVETTPGNYELVGNGSIGIPGKIFTSGNSITANMMKTSIGSTPKLSTGTTDSSKTTASASNRSQHNV